VSLLLNSRTYPNNDSSWSHGKLESLLPYITDLHKDHIDSIGFQGFPHMSAANATQKIEQLTTDEFLPVELITEAAKELETDTIWLNTGTFKHMYTDSDAMRVTLNIEQRKKILEDIANEAKELKGQGLATSINLFAEDKSRTLEHVDWSYLQPNAQGQHADAQVFDLFVRNLRTNDIGFSLYDRAQP
jgi:protoporphyrinogen oxidase